MSASLPTLEEEFPRIDDPPPDPVDLYRCDFSSTQTLFRTSCGTRAAELPIGLRQSGNSQVCSSIIVAAELRFRGSREELSAANGTAGSHTDCH